MQTLVACHCIASSPASVAEVSGLKVLYALIANADNQHRPRLELAKALVHPKNTAREDQVN